MHFDCYCPLLFTLPFARSMNMGGSFTILLRRHAVAVNFLAGCRSWGDPSIRRLN